MIPPTIVLGGTFSIRLAVIQAPDMAGDHIAITGRSPENLAVASLGPLAPGMTVNTTDLAALRSSFEARYWRQGRATTDGASWAMESAVTLRSTLGSTARTVRRLTDVQG